LALAGRPVLEDTGEVDAENKRVGRLRREAVDKLVVERVHACARHADYITLGTRGPG
jgi:hypothetical protein